MNSTDREKLFAAWLRDHLAIVQHVVRAFAMKADRNDLLQEVLLALWNAAPAFRGGSQAATFIYRVAHNAALLWCRTERRHRRRIDTAMEIDWMVQPETGRARSETPERIEALYTALQSLLPIDRSLMLLSLDGLGYREIAEIHGLSESNVGARLTRARQKLTDLLNPTSS